MIRFRTVLWQSSFAIASLFSMPSVVQAQMPKLPTIQEVHFQTDTSSIVNYGANGDGIFLNTEAINTAITNVSNQGGGVVLVPSGVWLTGPISLKSNVNLHLKRDAILLFTDDFDAYPLIEGNWEGQPAWRNQSPISGYNLENIAITGQGIIDGNGGAWRMVKRNKMTDSQWKKLTESGGALSADQKIWYPSASSLKGSEQKNAGAITAGKTAADFADIKDFLRPNLLILEQCKRILLEGVTFQNSPAWNVHPLLCEDLTIRNVMVRNPWYAQNGDGVDIESCKNVLIEGSTFDVGDDGICIKSGRDEAGRNRGVPTENVIIRNNIVYHAHGGFVIGSEMSGGARNIFVYDCSFIGTDIGLRFKTKRGRGGLVEHIYISNINMFNIPGEAILFDMYYEAVDPVPLIGDAAIEVHAVKLPVTEETPQFQNFFIKDVVAHQAEKAIFIRGLPEMAIKNIHLENISIKSNKGVEIIDAEGIFLKNIQLQTTASQPVVAIHNANNVQLNGLKHAEKVSTLVEVTGETTKNIRLQNLDATKAMQGLKLGKEVKSSTVRYEK